MLYYEIQIWLFDWVQNDLLIPWNQCIRICIGINLLVETLEVCNIILKQIGECSIYLPTDLYFVFGSNLYRCISFESSFQNYDANH